MSNFMCKLFAKLSGTIIVVACIHKKRDDELPTFSQLFLCSYFFLVMWLSGLTRRNGFILVCYACA